MIYVKMQTSKYPHNNDGRFREIAIANVAGDDMPLRVIENGITCGFTSPALDYIEDDITLQELFVKNKTATFFGRVVGNSLINAGFEPGGIMIIDRSLAPRDGRIAVCFLNGHFTAKKLEIKKNSDTVWLLPDCDGMKPVKVTPDDEFTIWGIVTWRCNPIP